VTNVICKVKLSVQSRGIVKGIRLRDLVLSRGHTIILCSVPQLINLLNILARNSSLWQAFFESLFINVT